VDHLSLTRPEDRPAQCFDDLAWAVWCPGRRAIIAVWIRVLELSLSMAPGDRILQLPSMASPEDFRHNRPPALRSLPAASSKKTWTLPRIILSREWFGTFEDIPTPPPAIVMGRQMQRGPVTLVLFQRTAIAHRIAILAHTLPEEFTVQPNCTVKLNPW
jgi:hypothetical protein